jgi:hypothetical protein
MRASAGLLGIAVIVLVPTFLILASLYMIGSFASYGGIFARVELNPAALLMQMILPIILLARKYSDRVR